MKKSTVATLIVLFVLVPLTIFLGSKLPGRSWYITSTLIVIEVMAPFFLAFEGRKPKARELVVIAVLCALAIVGRIAIPIPHFKAIFAVIMISGIAFGPEAGFLVGAVSAFVSDIFYSMGPFTPWQMLAFGVAGVLAGFLFCYTRLPRNRWVLGAFGFLGVFLVVGPILDTCSLFVGLSEITWKTAAATYAGGLLPNLCLAAGTLLTMLLVGPVLLEKLHRVQVKYGMLEGKHGI